MSVYASQARSVDSKPKQVLHVRIEPDGRMLTAIGRDAWALDKLINAGNRGCTPIDTPGPRWSHYVFKLRGLGLTIETVHESHGGPYPGHHARYILRNDLTVISDRVAA